MYKSRPVFGWATTVAFAAAVVLLFSLTAAPALAGGDDPGEDGHDGHHGNQGVLPPGSHLFGKTYGEWAAAWTRWMFAIPLAENPVFDLTGQFAAEGQSGPVWYLAGIAYDPANPPGPVVRTCLVPRHKYLFLPIINAFAQHNFDTDPSIPEYREQMAAWLDTVDFMSCTVDGHEIAHLFRYRAQDPYGDAGFSAYDPAGNIWDFWCPGCVPAGDYPTCVDGFWLMFEPLDRGQHEIHFVASILGEVQQDVTYHLTVGGH